MKYGSTAQQLDPSAPLPEGIVPLDAYHWLLTSEQYLEYENYSDDFIQKTESVLAPYRKRWVGDSLHQWSRQWEYPFVASRIFDSAKNTTAPKILDAGSGITFFPYLLKSRIPEAKITCCDYDETLRDLYKGVNKVLGQDLEYMVSDIRDTGLEKNSFDFVYCVSVLEHTGAYETIIDEFYELLRPGGKLLVTFDISLDGRSDIPVDEAEHLVATLSSKFERTTPVESLKNLTSQSIVSTEAIRAIRPSLLPWKFPILSATLSSIKKGKLPNFRMKQLTFSCMEFTKL